MTDPVHVAGHASATSCRPRTRRGGSASCTTRPRAGTRCSPRPRGSGPAEAHRLGAVGSGADLATPAASEGRLYTLDTGSGELWQIEPDGQTQPVPGAATYPYIKNLEKLNLVGAEVIARGGRVIFDARDNIEAEVVYSDGSAHPRTINKHTGLIVDPTGETTLANGANKATPKTTKKNKHDQGKTPPPKVSQPVTAKVDCKRTHQAPHIPQVTLTSAGPRSAQLQLGLPDPRPAGLRTVDLHSSACASTSRTRPRRRSRSGCRASAASPSPACSPTPTTSSPWSPTSARPTTPQRPRSPAAHERRGPGRADVRAHDASTTRATGSSPGTRAAACRPAASRPPTGRSSRSSATAAACRQRAGHQHRQPGDPTLHTFRLVVSRRRCAARARPDVHRRRASATTGTSVTATTDSSCNYSWTTAGAAARHHGAGQRAAADDCRRAHATHGHHRRRCSSPTAPCTISAASAASSATS